MHKSKIFFLLLFIATKPKKVLHSRTLFTTLVAREKKNQRFFFLVCSKRFMYIMKSSKKFGLQIIKIHFHGLEWLRYSKNTSSVDDVHVLLRARAFASVRKMAALVSVRACLSGKLQNLLIFLFANHWHRVYATRVLRAGSTVCVCICGCEDGNDSYCEQRKDARAFRKQGQVTQPVPYI